MAGGFNRVTLIGNLGDEPQVRLSQAGTSVATITLAINEYRRDQNGNKTESTEWVRVVAFGKTAETIGQYLHKGSQVHIEGKLRTRSYDDKDGNKRYITEVVCDPTGLLMLGSKATRDDYDKAQSTPMYNGSYDNAYASGPSSQPQVAMNNSQTSNNGGYVSATQNDSMRNSHGFQINQNPQQNQFAQNQFAPNNGANHYMNTKPQSGNYAQNAGNYSYQNQMNSFLRHIEF